MILKTKQNKTLIQHQYDHAANNLLNIHKNYKSLFSLHLKNNRLKMYSSPSKKANDTGTFIFLCSSNLSFSS